MNDQEAVEWINANAPAEIRWWIHDRLRYLPLPNLQPTNKMTPNETLEKLRGFDRQIIHGPRDFREMADTVEAMIKALTPFADAAAKVDAKNEDQLRLVGSRISEDASPGWGIRRKHLDAAREILGHNAEVSRGDGRASQNPQKS